MWLCRAAIQSRKLALSQRGERGGRQDRLLLLTTATTRIGGRRFSVHQVGQTKIATAGGSKRPIKPPEDLSKLLLEHPIALRTYLEKLTSEQRSEIHHLLRQQPPAAAASTATAASFAVPEPSHYDLRLVALNTAIPFVGFGIMDNSILIIAGDAIDTSLGVALGISTMCAAAIGNIVSDVAGVMLGTFVEDFTQKYMSVPSPVLSEAQRKLRSVRYASQFGCAVGLVIGCIIGMFPLAFMDAKKSHPGKQGQEADMDTMCQELVAQAGNLLGAERTVLFIRCDEPKSGNPSSSGFVPNPEGKNFHAKYTSNNISAPMDLQQRSSTSKHSHGRSEQPLIPLGRGIISRTALTQEACNIHNVGTDPDYDPSQDHGVSLHRANGVSASDEEQATPVKNMICVPVLDGNDHTIGVLQAINKVLVADDKGKSTAASVANDRGFTENDVQILKALASHMTVSLQRMAIQETEDGAPKENDEKMRLRDTIRILKDSGLAPNNTSTTTR